MYATNNRKSVNILNLFMVLLLCNSVYSLTDEEAKQQFLKYLLKCTKDNPVDMADLLPLQKFVVPTKHEVKCLLGCAYKTVGTLDKDGHYNLAKAYEIAKTMREGDDKREENAKKLADICSKVNEITDDAKACERATKLFQCVTENAPKDAIPVLVRSRLMLKRRQLIY